MIRLPNDDGLRTNGAEVVGVQDMIEAQQTRRDRAVEQSAARLPSSGQWQWDVGQPEHRRRESQAEAEARLAPAVAVLAGQHAISRCLVGRVHVAGDDNRTHFTGQVAEHIVDLTLAAYSDVDVA